MARFQLLAAHVFGALRVKAGKVIVEVQANAQPGDVVVGPLTSSSVTPTMKALDSAAVSLKNASPHASTPLPATITGASSIDG
jgi:hypothetical protein